MDLNHPSHTDSNGSFSVRTDPDDSSNLDHALLESLFYNEMMMMDHQSSNLLLSSLSYDGKPVVAPPVDVATEQAILSDFGVINSTPNQNHLNWDTSSNARATEQQIPSHSSNMVHPVLSSSVDTNHPDQKRKKLVSQFATLASRLGITLPPQVLDSLSAAAAEAKSPTANWTTSNETFANDDTDENTLKVAAATGVKEAPAAVRESKSTAEAAIAAVSETRKREEPKPPAYSKRRKKPRLVDCENKLAELKSENEMLKRHLANISSQSHKFEQERAEAEKRMKILLQQGGTDEELNACIQNYSEMYSDYGRRRHQELTFHLEQLQRLANPTNFTKMGLWTLGQQSKNSKRNPIAGILQRELGITAQQGRKILEQRQKIQQCSANLKECLVLLGNLKALCEQKTKIFNDRMTKCSEILTPRQTIQLLLWIHQHSGVLEKVCPGWKSEMRVNDSTDKQN